MDTRMNTNWLSQRLYHWEQDLELFSEKLTHKKHLLIIFVAILVFGLILAFIFAQMPITGENLPIPGYP